MNPEDLLRIATLGRLGTAIEAMNNLAYTLDLTQPEHANDVCDFIERMKKWTSAILHTERTNDD